MVEHNNTDVSPANDPSERVDLQLLRRNNKNVAACSIEVATWDDVPPLRASPEELLVASQHEGICWACHVDIKNQILAQGGDEEGIVPKRSYLNGMNRMYGFPGGSAGEQLRALFASATVLEAMIVALEHMQVSFVLARRTRLPKFVKNVISFPQDIAGFAARLGLLAGYRPGDRVNSSRGPEDGRNIDRPPKRAADLWEKERFAEDENGYLVFPAVVREIGADGRLILDYEDSEERPLGSGEEWADSVTPRVTMPWHPRFLKGQTKILLRRNLRGGKKLEGLEVRWRLVSNILQAWLCVGRWRLDGKEGPMHKYYDKRLFRVVSETDILQQYAPKGVDGSLEELRTEAELAAAGFDFGSLGAGEDDELDDGAADEEAFTEELDVDTDLFTRWMTVAGMSLGDVVQRWWADLEPAPEGCVVGVRQNWGDSPADLLVRNRTEVSAEKKCPDGCVPVRDMMSWFLENVGDGFAIGGSHDEQALLDR